VFQNGACLQSLLLAPRLRGADHSPLGIVVLISRSACGAALPLGIGCCLSSPCMKALS